MSKGQDLLARYDALKALVTERKVHFDAFVKMMEEDTSWLTSPASTRFHLNEEAGLLRHSVGVAETLLAMRAALAPVIPEESCVICGLFHDAGKVGMPGKPRYLRNDNMWEVKNRGKAYKVNRDEAHMGIAVRSLYLVGKYIPLSDVEAQAIVYHDGQYIDDNKSVALREAPLSLLLHWADMWTMKVFEEKVEIDPGADRYDRKEAE